MNTRRNHLHVVALLILVISVIAISVISCKPATKKPLAVRALSGTGVEVRLIVISLREGHPVARITFVNASSNDYYALLLTSSTVKLTDAMGKNLAKSVSGTGRGSNYRMPLAKDLVVLKPGATAFIDLTLWGVTDPLAVGGSTLTVSWPSLNGYEELQEINRILIADGVICINGQSCLIKL